MSYRIKKKTTSVTILAEGTTANADSVALNGRICGISINCPALVGTTTLTVTLKDADGAQLYQKASIPEGAVSNYYVDATPSPLNIPVCGPINITCLASNAQTGAAAVIPVTLLVDEGV